MRPFRRRALTAGERVLAAEMFGQALDPHGVQVLAVRGWGRAFVAGPKLIVWPAAGARGDFSAPHVPLGEQATFVHELTHVWQAQNGVALLRAKLRAGDGPAAYRYALGGGERFIDLNIEQQAMVVEHAFLRSRGAAAPYPAEAYAAVLPDWTGRGRA